MEYTIFFIVYETGREVTLESNHFPITFHKREFAMYVADFQPPIDPADVPLREITFNMLFRRQVRKEMGMIVAFTGANLYAISDVKEIKEFSTPDNEKRLMLKYIRRVDPEVEQQHGNTVYNIMMKQLMKKAGLIQINRQYFSGQWEPLKIQQYDRASIVNLLPGMSSLIMHCDEHSSALLRLVC
jgi:hypothetical protein